MTDEEYQRERAEAARLEREISHVIDRINRTKFENGELEAELAAAANNVNAMINSCVSMGNEVYAAIGGLSEKTGTADVSTREVFSAINELTLQYFSFKNISTASKNLTRYNDEYFTRFSYYNELRRISLGYVIGLDSNIISSETARKKVEKAYLQNTDYWLAYCISAVMLWANDEREAAERALGKSLSVNYLNSCLFFLLVCLRFDRIDAAKKWYVNFLDRAGTEDLGDEWQYLLQAYLFGAFGADENFRAAVAKCFRDMLLQAQASTVDFAGRFTDRAVNFAEMYAYRTDKEYTLLRRGCSEYIGMKELLSAAEKNAVIARYYGDLADCEVTEDAELPQRIENVLYSLINDYDDEEREVVRKIKYNEAVIAAKGDIAAAQANADAAFSERSKKKDFGGLMLDWAFDSEQADVSVRRFAVSFMKEPIAKGFERYAERYRSREKETYPIDIDGCVMECDENGYAEAEKLLDGYYEKSRLRDIFGDKQVRIYSGICVLALVMLLVLFIYFTPVILTFGILAGLTGSFLLWRRIVDMGNILKEKKRKGKLLLRQTLEELGQWRTAYKEADAENAGLLDAVGRF